MIKRLAHVFSLDLRSIAVTRMALGVLVIVDLVSRARYLSDHYGDRGVLPSSLIDTFWAGDWAWSLHVLGGGPLWLLVGLFVVHGIAAAALTVGFRTRVASVVTWILTTSLHSANILILDGGDVILRLFLFIGIFLPWGAVFSLDSVRANARPASYTFVSGWSVAYLLQIGLFYFFASLLKDGAEWTREWSAVYYALSIDQYATTLAKFLLNFPDLLTVLTFSVVTFQHIALFLIFSPFLTPYLRAFAALALMCMHFSFTLMLHLWIFSWVAIAGLIGILPTAVWEWGGRVVEKMRGVRIVADDEQRVIIDYAKDVGGAYGTVLGLLFFVFTFLWQVNALFPLEERVTGVWEVPIKILRIDQRWGLFAPRPFKNDGWYVIEGVLSDGERVDLLRGGPVTFEKPESVFYSYPNVRWRKYLYELRQDENEQYRRYYGEYLCSRWNDGDTLDQRLLSVNMVYMIEMTPSPGEMYAAPRPYILGVFTCGS